MSAPPAPAKLRQWRTGMVVAGVVALHALALWGMQSALQWPLFRPVEALLPMQVKLIVLPVPPAAPPPAPQPAPQPPIRQPAKPPKPPKPIVAQRAPQPAPRVVLQPAPQAAPPADPQPAPEAPSASMDEPAAAPSSAPAAPSAPPAVAAAPAAAQPSSEAQCPGNSRPRYPPMSRQMDETGQVIVGVLIGADGRVEDVNLQRSSGYPRLDDAALQAVRHWRCKPVVRDGVPQAQWRNAQVDFVLH